MNGPSPKFWVLLKRTMVILAGLSLLASVVLYFFLEGLYKTFIPVCGLIIAANFLFVYFFVRMNDSKRPSNREFDVHHRTRN